MNHQIFERKWREGSSGRLRFLLCVGRLTICIWGSGCVLGPLECGVGGARLLGLCVEQTLKPSSRPLNPKRGGSRPISLFSLLPVWLELGKTRAL